MSVGDNLQRNIQHYSCHQSKSPLKSNNGLKDLNWPQIQNLHPWSYMFPCNLYSKFSQHFLLTTISNSSNHKFELNHDFELACLSMLMVIINPGLNERTSFLLAAINITRRWRPSTRTSNISSTPHSLSVLMTFSSYNAVWLRADWRSKHKSSENRLKDLITRPTPSVFPTFFM